MSIVAEPIADFGCARDREVLHEEVHDHVVRHEVAAVRDRRLHAVGVPGPWDVEPRRVGVALGVHDEDVGTLPVVATRPGPDRRIGPAPRSVVELHLGGVAAAADHLETELRRTRGIVLFVVRRLLQDRPVAVDVHRHLDDHASRQRWLEDPRDHVGADDRAVLRQQPVADVGCLTLPVLEVVVPAVGAAHLDAREIRADDRAAEVARRLERQGVAARPPPASAKLYGWTRPGSSQPSISFGPDGDVRQIAVVAT